MHGAANADVSHYHASSPEAGVGYAEGGGVSGQGYESRDVLDAALHEGSREVFHVEVRY
jgi:hypothetical protein